MAPLRRSIPLAVPFTALTLVSFVACGGSDAAEVEATSLADAGASKATSADDGSARPPPASDAAVGRAPLDPAAALRAAVFVGSCIEDDRANRYLASLYAELVPESRLRAAVSCFAGRRDGCAAVEACLGVAARRVQEECADSCDGDVAIRCDDAIEYRTDCARQGRTCAMVGKRATCLPKGASVVACDYASFSSSCQDGRPTYCSAEGKVSGPMCAAAGLACAGFHDGYDTTHMCQGTEGVCEPRGYGPSSAGLADGLSCNGGELQACVNGGKLTVDCASVAPGFTCQVSTKAKFCGLAAECDPGGGAPSCEGTHLVVCNAGKVEKVDCTTYGFTGCDALTGMCTPNAIVP